MFLFRCPFFSAFCVVTIGYLRLSWGSFGVDWLKFYFFQWFYDSIADMKFMTHAARIYPYYKQAYFDAQNSGVHMTWVSWSIIGLFAVLCFFGYLSSRKGSLAPSLETLRGMDFADFKVFAAIVKKAFPNAEGLKIHPQIQLPPNRETENFLALGAIGSGKTAGIVNYVLSQLVDDFKSGKRKDKVILYDYKGDFTEQLMGIEGVDVKLMAPWDTRGVKWALWKDFKRVTDAALIAMAAIPHNPNVKDPKWDNMARDLFEKTLMCLYSKFGREILTFSKLNAIMSDMPRLRALLADYDEGRKALSYIEEDNAQTQGVKSSFYSATTWLGSVARAWEDTDCDFSLRQWMDNGKGGIMILRNHPEFTSLAGPMVVMSYNLMMQQHIGRGERWKDFGKVFYVIDEFPTLPPIQNILKAIPTLRSLGGCFLLTAQDISQLQQTYGKEGAQTILSQSSTRVIYKVDGDTAETCAKILGNKEEKITRFSESDTKQKFELLRGSKGTSIAADLRTVPVVLPGEFQSLKRADQIGKAEGYLQMSGFPVTKATWPLTFFPKISPAEITAGWVNEPLKANPLDYDGDSSGEGKQDSGPGIV